MWLKDAGVELCTVLVYGSGWSSKLLFQPSNQSVQFPSPCPCFTLHRFIQIYGFKTALVQPFINQLFSPAHLGKTSEVGIL